MATPPRNSTGPRTTAGKVRSSYNALRHGLAATTRRQFAPPGDVERVAQTICGDEDDQVLLQAARAIAENEFVLSAIRRQKIIVIERLREASAIALRKGDNSFTLAIARIFQAWLAYREIQLLAPRVMKQYEAQLLPPPEGESLGFSHDIVPIRVKCLLEETVSSEEEERALDLAIREVKRQQRNEYEALQEAIPDLKRLERYERRAWSRQKRAVREFLNLKFTRSMLAARQRDHEHSEVGLLPIRQSMAG